MINCNNKQTRSGFSLLETLLTTIVVATIFVIIFNIISDFAENTLARTTANYMNKLSGAVEEILENPENFQNIYAEADANANDVLELTVADLSSGFNAGGAFIAPSASINNNIRNNTPLRTGVEIMIRIADDPISNADVRALEIIIATSDRVKDTRVRKAASAAKIYGGSYREAGLAQSAYASWSFNPLVTLNGTAWAATIATNPPDLGGEGTYLMHYKHMNIDDIAGDYLYRVAIPGSPEFNQIYTNLNMGGNDVLGADNINVTNDLNIDSKIISKGNASALNMTLTDGNFTANRRLITSNATINGLGAGTTGNFTVQDRILSSPNPADPVSLTVDLTQNLSAVDANFTNGMNATTSLSVDEIADVDNITTQDMFITQLDTISDVDLIVTNQLNIQGLDSQTLTVNTGDVGTVDASITNGVSVDAGINSSRITIDTLEVGDFGVCDNDCLPQ